MPIYGPDFLICLLDRQLEAQSIRTLYVYNGPDPLSLANLVGTSSEIVCAANEGWLPLWEHKVRRNNAEDDVLLLDNDLLFDARCDILGLVGQDGCGLAGAFPRNGGFAPGFL